MYFDSYYLPDFHRHLFVAKPKWMEMEWCTMIRSDGEDKFFVQTNLTNADKNTNESKTNKKSWKRNMHAPTFIS